MVWFAVGFTAALLAALLLFLLRSSPRCSDLSRRSHLRLLILGATGLSLLSGCGGDGGPPDSLLGRWTRLGRIWRDLSTYLRGPRGRGQEFAELQSSMKAALDALPAWPELRAVFETRYEHIARILSGLPCYAPLPPGCYPYPQFRVEDRVEHLEKLVAEGRLSQRAALRAAGVLAIPAEYLVQEGEIKKLPYDERYPALDELDERYCNGTLEAGPAAELAGQRLVELTVDNLGWLAGPPEESEGSAEAPAEARGPGEGTDR